MLIISWHPSRTARSLIGSSAWLGRHPGRSIRGAGTDPFGATLDPDPCRLVKHLARVERFWFSIDFAGLDLPGLGPRPTRMEGSDSTRTNCCWTRSPPARQSAAVQADHRGRRPRGPGPWPGDGVHPALCAGPLGRGDRPRCGHLGLLREALDGQTGEWPYPGHPWGASRACAISPRGGEPRRSRESWKRAWE
jgi:hypothetical protein